MGLFGEDRGKRLAVAHLHGTNNLKYSLLTLSEHTFMASSQAQQALWLASGLSGSPDCSSGVDSTSVSTKTRLGEDAEGLNSFPTRTTQHTGTLRTLGTEQRPRWSLLSSKAWGGIPNSAPPRRLMAPRYLQAIPEAPGLLFLPGSPSLLYCHLGLLLPAGKGVQSSQ